MGRASSNAVVWLADQGAYALRDGEQGEDILVRESARWFDWLDARRSFAFHGAAGQISLLKEARAASRAGYWYAYRRHGTRTRKQYAGRSAELSFAHLEAIAATLCQPPDPAATAKEQAGDALPAMSTGSPLLAPKLQIPRLPPALIEREQLFAALEAGRRQVLTLLCAPPGYGKTTLVRQWLGKLRIENEELRNAAEKQHSQFSILNSSFKVAWVSLDAGDNDPIRFWRYVISACEPLLSDGGATALALLQLPTQPSFEPSPLEPALTVLLNTLAHTARPGVLVLDDYHVIAAPRIHTTLVFFLEHLPASLHVTIISRREPPLPLARLRARGELSEITAADLRFTPDEMGVFLASTGAPRLPPITLRQLGEQLEGWPAGLRLLALALRGSAAPHEISATLASFAGSQRPIMDYFVSEVLHGQPEAVQDFLLRTSMLRRLNAELCESIVGPGSATLLAELELANLFLEPVGGTGQWYRYHALFAEAMQAAARQRLDPKLVRELSLRASEWYEQHSMRAEAIETALHAGDTNRAADLLAQIAVTAHLGLDNVQINTHTEFHTLRRWLEQIPDAELEQRPVLFVSYATALVFVALVDQVPLPPATLAQIETLLARAEAAFQTAGDTFRLGEVFAFRAMITRQRGALDEAVRWGREALALLPPGELAWRSIALGAVGLGALAEGEFGAAEAAFHEAHELCTRIGNRWWTRANAAMLSYVLLERGALHQAAARFEHMLAEAREQNDTDDVARAQICLAHIAYEWNNLDAAEQAATEALALGEHLMSDEICVQAALRLARVQHAQEQAAAARQRLAVLLARLQTHYTPLAARLAREVLLQQASFQLAAGDTAAVEHWARSLDAAPIAGAALLRERETRVVAQLRIAQGTANTALEILTPMLAAAQAGGRTRCVIETQALLALAHAACGQPRQAAQHLRAALLGAAPEGYQRLFLDLGQPLQDLLLAMQASERDPRLQRSIAGLRHASGQAAGGAARLGAPNPLADPLSRHERRVLRLLAAGRSNPEIARELIVSVNTVRSQVQSIFRKLGVHNRVAASDIARQLDLLNQRD